MKPSKILGQLGDDNYRVEDCPMAIPKNNMKFFQYMRTQANTEPFDNYQQYGNAYREDWHKPAKMDKQFLKIMEAINNGIKKALNEKLSLKGIEEHNAKNICNEIVCQLIDKELKMLIEKGCIETTYKGSVFKFKCDYDGIDWIFTITMDDVDELAVKDSFSNTEIAAFLNDYSQLRRALSGMLMNIVYPVWKDFLY